MDTAGANRSELCLLQYTSMLRPEYASSDVVEEISRTAAHANKVTCTHTIQH